MKVLGILAIGAIVMSLGLTSCSQCYTCTTEVNLINSSTGDTTFYDKEEDLCTAAPSEVDDKEADGYTCVPN